VPGDLAHRPVQTTHPARRRLFVELIAWMVGLGLVAGLVFPPFVVLLGVPESLAYKPRFYAACLGAGLMVGALNFLVACRLVRPRVKLLSDGMRRFRMALVDEDRVDGVPSRGAERFHVPVDSQDELGRAADSFNRLIDVLVSARRIEESVRAFSNTLASQLDLAPLCREALSVMLARTGAVAGALLIVRDGSLECGAAYGLSDPDGLSRRVEVREALDDLKTRQVESPSGVLLTAGPEVYPREMLLLPLAGKDGPTGMLVLASLSPFTPESFRLLDFFRQSLKLALQNALSHERLGRIAAMDSLTGCYNRRMGMERLTEEFSRAWRSGDPLGLIMFDIDHFKPVNDTWGHLAGDRILVRTARTVERVLREGDVLVRYGGEEFLVLLPGAPLEEAASVAERVRRAVEAMEISGDGPERITVSVGVGAVPMPGVESADVLLQRVDEALYQAKAAGRNRVVHVPAGDDVPA
jgi:two-component system, cell cycle response regulator